MRATLNLKLSDAWVDEPSYASALSEVLARMREIAFVDVSGQRTLADGNYQLRVLATFDYDDELHYAERLTEVMEYAREYHCATLVSVERGDGQASDGHLPVSGADGFHAPPLGVTLIDCSATPPSTRPAASIIGELRHGPTL